MQTTLLGLAIAIIVTMVAAMIGPFFINWDEVRPYAEAEARNWIGAPVRISGAIDARLLPTPTLHLHAVEIGAPGARETIRIGEVAVEFALGPLLRGEWRAAEMHVVAPELSLALDAKGGLVAPKLAVGFAPEALSIDRLTIADGRVRLSDARSGGQTEIDKLAFSGDLRSLLGPFRGEGAFMRAGERYAYRVSVGRMSEDGAFKIKLNLDPSDQPFRLETEGMLALADGAPRYDGALKVERLAGFVDEKGERLAGDPWSVAARLAATPDKALLEKIEFQFGPEERAIRLSGAAEVRLRGPPRFDGVLSALQIDLDRALASAMSESRKPADVLRTLAHIFTGALRPGIPGRVGIGIETLTMAGADLRTVRGDLTTDGESWALEGFEFRAPGLSQVTVTGQLDVDGRRLGFAGPVALTSNDPNALVAWLKGGSDNATAPLSPLKVEGDVTLSAEKVAIERMRAEIDRKTVEGQLVYEWGSDAQPARLDAQLKAGMLDVDSLFALANSARGATQFEMPRDIALALDADRATLGGLEARAVSAAIHRDADGLRIDRLQIADIGGTRVEASGAIDTRRNIPYGALALAIEARDTARLLPLAARYLPDALAPLTQLAARLPAAKLNGTLKVAGAGEATLAELTAKGEASGLDATLTATARPRIVTLADGEGLSFKDMPVTFAARLASPDSRLLAQRLGLADDFTLAARPGEASVTMKGELGGTFAVETTLAAAGLAGEAGGTVRFVQDGPQAAFKVALRAADAKGLRGGATPPTNAPLPLTLRAQAGWSKSALALDKIEGTLAGAAVGGRLDLKFPEDRTKKAAGSVRISGALTADAVDVPALVAATLGAARMSADAQPAATPVAAAPPRRGAGSASVSTQWAAAPFAPGLLGGFLGELDGSVRVTAPRVWLTPAQQATQATGDVTFARGKVSIEKITATLAGGALMGRFDLEKSAGGVDAGADLSLKGADVAVLVSPQEKSAIRGHLSGQLAARGAGRSPVALIGALTGTGVVTLEGAQFAGLDPKAFDLALLAADRGLKIDAGDVGEVVEAGLKAGRLVVPAIKGTLSLGGGQIRLAPATAQASGAEAGLSGSYDLLDARLDARVTLTANRITPMAGVEAPMLLVSLRGPLDAPQRQTDVSAFSAWLTLRAIDAQTKRLEALEVARRAEEVRREAEERQRREENAKREALDHARREDEARQAALEKAKRDEAAQAKAALEKATREKVAREKAAADKAREEQQAADRARRESALQKRQQNTGEAISAEPEHGAGVPALPPPIEIGPAAPDVGMQGRAPPPVQGPLILTPQLP